MNIDQLLSLVQDTAWFSRLGESSKEIDGQFVCISTLAPWAAILKRSFFLNAPIENQLSLADNVDPWIVENMQWFPSSREEDDPIHGCSLEERAELLGKRQELSQEMLQIYKTAASALSKANSPLLKIGPHDFTEAARGSALFAVRRAAYEVLLGEPSYWSELLSVYKSGHWPCGVLPDRRIVVF